MAVERRRRAVRWRAMAAGWVHGRSGPRKIGWRRAMAVANIARTDHATLESSTFCQLLDRHQVHTVAAVGKAIPATT